MNMRIIIFLLFAAQSIVAMQVHPAGVEPKKGCCARMGALICAGVSQIRECCKTQAQRDAEWRALDLKRQDEERAAKKQREERAREFHRQQNLRTFKSVDLRRATGGAIGEEVIQQIKKLQHEQEIDDAVERIENTAHHVTVAAVRAVTPTLLVPGLQFSFSSDLQPTERASTMLMIPAQQQQVSPTPPSQARFTTEPVLTVEDI